MRLRAKEEFLEKALPPGFYRNHDEDLKMISTSRIESLFTNLKIDYKGTIRSLGYNDEFIPQGNVDTLYRAYKLDCESISKAVINLYD